jgi:Cu/Ag efflux protein CusF
MIARLYRPLVMGLLPITLIACMNSAPTIADEGATVPLGVDLGGSGPVAAAAPAVGHVPTPQYRNDMQMAHTGHNDAHGTGTVNSVDPAHHKVNLSHMTMDFPVNPSVDLNPIKPGSRVNFTIEKGQSGMYEIQAISPAAGSR